MADRGNADLRWYRVAGLDDRVASFDVEVLTDADLV